MNCGQCGAEVLEGAKFCTKCGAAVPREETPPERSRGLRRKALVLGAGIVAVGALVLLGVLLIGPFPGGDGESATETAATAPGANMFRGNPAHTGEYPGPGPEGSPTLLWRFKMGGIDEDSSPAVVDGILYVESNDGNVYAVDARTGDLRWSFETGTFYPSSPAVVDGVVYSAVNESGLHEIYALEARNGKMLWQFDRDDGGSSPVVVKSVVYVGGGNCVYALSADSGGMLWRFDTGHYVNGSPAVVDGVVYVASGLRVHAVDAETGEMAWRSEIGGQLSCSPVVADGVVYVGSLDGYLYALDAGNGGMLWRFHTGHQGLDSPAVARGVVYVDVDASGVAEDGLYALDADTGRVRWRSESVGGSNTVADGVVYVTDSTDVCALKADGGETLWCFETGSELETSPVVVNGVAYVLSEDGYVYAIGGSQGQ